MIALEVAAFWMTGCWQARNGSGALAVTGASIQAGTVVLVAGGGTLRSILVVTNNGANPILIYDNAVLPIGTVVAVVPANAVAGTRLDFYQIGYSYGLVIAQTAGAGNLTIQF